MVDFLPSRAFFSFGLAHGLFRELDEGSTTRTATTFPGTSILYPLQCTCVYQALGLT